MHVRHGSVKVMLVALGSAASCAGFARCADAADDRARAVFFFSPGCRMCAETKEAVRAASAHFGARLEVEWVDLSDPTTGTASAARLFHMLDARGVAETPELAFFVGGECIAGGERILEEIVPTVERALAGGAPAVSAVARDRLGFWAVSAAALADGINPCAFATIVLLVSMMATAHRTRREILAIGGAFTCAVFLTYAAIGLALYGVLARLRGFFVVSDVIYTVAFGACVLCGVLSLYDATLAARGRDAHDMILKLPDSLRERIQRRLSTGMRSRALLATAFATGVVVSVFESACTGQVYFPVIAGLVRAPGTLARGLGLLAWYNALFVLPLVAILGLSVAGVGSARLAGFGRAHWGLAKLALACVFVAMAMWMYPGLAWPPGVR